MKHFDPNRLRRAVETITSRMDIMAGTPEHALQSLYQEIVQHYEAQERISVGNINLDEGDEFVAAAGSKTGVVVASKRRVYFVPDGTKVLLPVKLEVENDD